MVKEIKVLNRREDIKKYYGDVLSKHNWYISNVPIENDNVRFNIFSYEDKKYIVVLDETIDEYNNKKEMEGMHESKLF